MRNLLVGLIALVVGVGGGAYLSGSKVKERILAEAAQAAADSAAAHTDPADGGDHGEPEDGHGDVGVDGSTHASGSDSAHVEDPDSAARAAAAALAAMVEEQRIADSIATAEAAARAAEAETQRLAEEGARKLSKIFGAMQAEDAGAVLQEMSDEEVVLILTQMSDRLAAQILGVFEPARAAALTRVVLGSARTGS